MPEMVLKSNSNDFFDLTLELKIDLSYGNEYIGCLVVLKNKINNKMQIERFDPNKIRDALDYYAQQEAMFIKV